jgi:protein-S-isoprenylcysteine O-methyltransferase Ste14
MRFQKALELFGWSFFFEYDPLTFLGIRQIMTRNLKNEKYKKMSLKKKGLLGIVRHPMYFAGIIHF